VPIQGPKPGDDRDTNPSRPASGESRQNSAPSTQMPASGTPMPPPGGTAARAGAQPSAPAPPPQRAPAVAQKATKSADDDADDDAVFELFGPVHTAGAGAGAVGAARPQADVVASPPSPVESPGPAGAGDGPTGEDDRRMRHVQKMVAKLSTENSDLQASTRPGPARPGSAGPQSAHGGGIRSRPLDQARRAGGTCPLGRAMCGDVT
jgi:hypothetical protein